MKPSGTLGIADALTVYQSVRPADRGVALQRDLRADGAGGGGGHLGREVCVAGAAWSL